MRLGTNIWIGYEPLFLARQQGYINTESIKLVEFLSASEVIRAFRNQSLEAAALTLDEALLLVERNIPIKIILVTDVSAGADALISKPEINNIEALIGKRIGVESGALGAYMISRALEINGIKLDQIKIVNLEVSEHETAYKENKVDALVTFEPTRTKLLAEGAKELFTSREIPQEIVDVIVVHSDYLEKNRDKVKELISGWFKALKYIQNNREDAAEKMSERMQLSSKELLNSYAGVYLPNKQENLTLLAGQSPELQSTVHRLQHTMVANQLLESTEMTTSLIDPLVQELYEP
ncbi:MAG: ABC transporter substrate-binding protein [Gammaproteobacteria bacterium]